MKKENGKARVLNKTEFNRGVKFQMSTLHWLRNVLLLHLSFFIGLRSKEMSALTIGDLIDVNGDLKEEATLKRHQTKRNKQRRFYLTNDKLKKVVKLNVQYISTTFVESNKKSDLKKIKTPLTLSLCVQDGDMNNCGHLQLYEITDPDLLYRKYFYRSSASDTMKKDLIIKYIMSALKNKFKRGKKMAHLKLKDEKLIVAKIIKLSNGE